MSNSTINIKEVFTHGRLGPITLGQTIAEVEELLGKPTNLFNSIYGADDEYNIKFLRYEGYEFWFIQYYDESGEYKLSAFQVRDYLYENGYAGQFKQGITLDTWIFRHGMTLTDLEKALDSENMRYSKSEENDFTVLTFENNAKIYCIAPDDSKVLLCEGWTYHPINFLAK